MARSQHLDHAPITEALIDFRVDLGQDFDPRAFLKLKDELGETYPRFEVIRVVEGNIRISDQELSQTTSDRMLFGYRLGNQDSDRITQLRVNGFTYSKLHPYTSWTDVFTEAWRLWERYVAVSRPAAVTRVAVRYINHIEIPPPFCFSEFLTDPPTIPDSLPQTISTYFKRVTVDEPDTRLSANIIQAVDRPDASAMRFLLDIDVYRNHTFDLAAEKLKSSFSDLRALKNRIFFGSIRDEAVRLFQ